MNDTPFTNTNIQIPDPILLDRIKGCLIGGAVGDALGYAVEFIGESAIFGRYGADGITSYELSRASGKAIVSDDTQMTLFTACGCLNAATNSRLNHVNAMPCDAIAAAYHDWYLTQNTTFSHRGNRTPYTWLWNVPELFAARAPGITCMSALSEKAASGKLYGYEKARNNSKGCGGVMRVAPLGLYRDHNAAGAADQAAKAAALTHGHPLGYIPAAMLAHLIHNAVFSRNDRTFRQITEDSLYAILYQFQTEAHIDDFANLINKALTLCENDARDLDNIHRLGEGWVGDEALAIALYCCLKYPDDFDKCITVSVNHKGDSDSTGAIAGNILGAWLGASAIGEKWTRDPELLDVIETLSNDLCALDRSSDAAVFQTDAWQKKYVDFTFCPDRK